MALIGRVFAPNRPWGNAPNRPNTVRLIGRANPQLEDARIDRDNFRFWTEKLRLIGRARIGRGLAGRFVASSGRFCPSILVITIFCEVICAQ